MTGLHHCRTCGEPCNADGICEDCEAAWAAYSDDEIQPQDTTPVKGSGFCQCGTPVESDELGALCGACRQARRCGYADFAEEPW
jgi:hypothetical protein